MHFTNLFHLIFCGYSFVFPIVNFKKYGSLALTVKFFTGKYEKSVLYCRMKILVMNGPNLQLLGRRKAEFYGSATLSEIEKNLRNVARELEIELDFMQSNSEGVLVDKIAESIESGVDGIVINPAAYTHTSIALRDAIEASLIPVIEVHLSNINARDEFRKISLTASVCIGQMTGLGADGYEWALRALVRSIKQSLNNKND